MREEREWAIAEALYYHVAQDALEAGRRADRFERAQQFVVCMVFSALALEAYINRQLGASGDSAYSGPEREWGLDPEEKWLTCSHAYGATRTFARGAQPFQDFSHLVRLRNQRLVHFKPADELIADGLGKHPTSYADLVLDERLAARCFASVGSMIRQLHDLTNGQTELPAFLDGSRYLGGVSASVTVCSEHLGPDGQT